MPSISVAVYLNEEDKKVFDANRTALNIVTREFFKEKLRMFSEKIRVV